MNRCPHRRCPPPLRRLLPHLALAALLLGQTAEACAQTYGRRFPAHAERGTLVVLTPPQVQVNGKAERLSPGARIRGVNGLLLMSGSIAGQALAVNFVRDPAGELHEVWLLTPAEVASPLSSHP